MTKTALITGGARGIGLATARLFLADGWHVALVDWDAEELARAAPEDALALSLDISNPQHAPQMVRETVARFGRIDAVVNNAGIAEFGPI
ncbi:MAG: SDR family NAD(P)-dependent oxidoreductase, partial [Pseudomonadota bacterium]